MANYDFRGRIISSSGLEPRTTGLGMIEFHLNSIGIPGGKDALMIGLSKFSFPDPRVVEVGEIQYLNGVVRFPKGVRPTGDIECTFNDYLNGAQRQVLQAWFDRVHDDRTGLGSPVGMLKCNACAVMFDRAGREHIRYDLFGLFPLGDPQLPSIDYGSVDFITLTTKFSVDYYEDHYYPIAQAGMVGAAQVI